MGKKSRLKQIKRAAAQLPEFQQHAYRVVHMSPDELAKHNELCEAENRTDKKLDPNMQYIRREGYAVRVNHARRLKRHVQKHGMAGYVGYIKAVEEFAAQNKTDNGNTINEN